MYLIAYRYGYVNVLEFTGVIMSQSSVSPLNLYLYLLLKYRMLEILQISQAING
jgi:hypothetical protein